MTDKPYLNPDYCTRNDAARLAGVTVLTISNWIKSGRIRALNLDGRVYVEKASLPIRVTSLGLRLKIARCNKRMKVIDVADKLQFSRFTLHKYEADEREVPANRLSLLAQLYGVSVKWLMDGRE